VVGALLILGLLAAPAGAASRITTRPLRAMALSAAIAVASVWYRPDRQLRGPEVATQLRDPRRRHPSATWPRS